MNKKAAWNKKAIVISFIMVIMALVGLVLIFTSWVEFAQTNDEWKKILCLSLGIIFLVGAIIVIVIIALLAKRRDGY